MSVSVLNRTRARLPEGRIRRIARRIAQELRRQNARTFRAYDLAIVFVGDREARTLHERFLRKPKPASILSFDYGSSGEIVLNPGAIRREAREARTSFRAHLFRLMVHGAAHLAGIHHEGSRSAERNADRWEADLNARLGLGDAAGASLSTRRNRRRNIHAQRIRRH